MSGGAVAIVRVAGWSVEAEAIALDGPTWNGWLRPTFDPASALQTVDKMNAEAAAEGLDWQLVVDGDQAEEISDGEPVDLFHLSTLGNGAWAWEVAR